ncbi:MAG: prolipoprotein diacylglyceryl transferase [Eubacteriales bacterium]|nr:prolipoprotein diacylglyceryl transferase [Eubacteriales bacterium]
MQSPGAIAFTLGGLQIRWYGILITIGALLASIISYKRAPKHGIKPDDVLDLILWTLPIGIIGARLYYVVFAWDEFYRDNPMQAFNIRGGGLAIHGGLIFGLITAYIVCRRKKIPFLEMADLVLPTVALAQSIGRWGNFFNSEAYGRPTNLPWAILVNGQHVHPTFLYESIWCFLLFFSLIYMDNHHRKFSGQIMCLYGMLYSLERFFVESLRTDSLMIGPFRQAMVLSATVFLACGILYMGLRKRKQGKNVH